MYVFFCLMIRRPPRSTRTDTLFPYTTLVRSLEFVLQPGANAAEVGAERVDPLPPRVVTRPLLERAVVDRKRAEVVDDLAVGAAQRRAEIDHVDHAGGISIETDRDVRLRDVIAFGDGVLPEEQPPRSEGRRGGKEGGSTVSARWVTLHKKKKK